MSVSLAQEQTLVSLSRESISPQQALKELGSQAGIAFETWPSGLDLNPPENVSVRLNRSWFWPSVLAVTDQAGLRLRPATLDPNERRVEVLRARDAAVPPPAAISYPMYIRYEGSIARAHEPGTLEATLTAYTDPAIRNFVFAEGVAISGATDSAGRSLLVRDERELPPPPGMITRHRIILAEPQGQIAKLHGTFTLLQSDKVDVWTIKDPAKAKNLTRKLGSSTFEIVSLERRVSGYELKLHIKGPANGGFKAGAQELVVGQTSLQLTDAAGKPWRISNIEGRYQSKEITGIGAYHYTIQFAPTQDKPGDIATLTWRIPLQVSTVEVPFELKNIEP